MAKIFLTSGIEWAGVLTDGSDITVECIGGGGAGRTATTHVGCGGGGGEYRILVVPYLSNTPITGIQIGQGGATDGADGTATIWDTNIIVAQGGEGAADGFAGAGGTSGSGGLGADGGAGGGKGNDSFWGAGGGGAGGPDGVGADGGEGGLATGGGGQGGSGGGGGAGGGLSTAGGPSTNADPSGAGGLGPTGTAGGVGVSTGPGLPGSEGSGGSGAAGTTGTTPADVGGAGGAGIDFDATHGAGGGGGGGGGSTNVGGEGGRGGAGGLYGGGGGGGGYGANVKGPFGAGAQGLIVITYSPGYVVSVAGEERDPLKWTFQIAAPINGISTMRADFESSGSPLFRPALDSEITVVEASVKIFGGYITHTREREFDGVNGEYIVVETTSADYRIAATRRIVNETIPDPGSPALVLKDILQILEPYLTDYGITLDPAQVDGPEVDPVVYEDRVLKDILDELSILTGYAWDIDVDKFFRMYAIGDAVAPFDLDEADLPARYFGDITVEPSRDRYANRVMLRYGPDGNADTTDTFFADGLTDTFRLSAPLVGPNYNDNSVGYGYVTTNAGASPPLNETLGLIGTLGVEWEYDPDHIDGPSIIYTPGNVPAGNIVRITYTGQFPVSLTVEDAGEIATHRIFEMVIPKADTMDRTVAIALAAAELVKHTSVLRRVTYSTRERGLKPGQTQNLDVPKRDLDTSAVLVEVVTESEPGGDLLVRRVTALEGTVIQGDWRDLYRQWLGA